MKRMNRVPQSQGRTKESVTLASAVDSTTNLPSPRKRDPQPKNCLGKTGLWPCLWGIFLIANCAIPRQVDRNLS